MGKRFLRAAACAAAILFAGQASATVMEAKIDGNWNDDFSWDSWSFDVVYDTSSAIDQAWTDPLGAAGHTMTVPILSETMTLHGYKTWHTWLGDYDTFTPIPDEVTNYTSGAISIYQSPNTFVWQLLGGTVGTSADGLNLGYIPFDQAGDDRQGFYNYLMGFSFMLGEVWTRDINLTVLSAAPEPASWAMMFLGFFGLGAALRRQRRGTEGFSAE